MIEDTVSQAQRQGLGLTDCISFVVMQEQKVNKAMTIDRHFIQAGFRALMRENQPNI